jgi:hypothetical protein
MEKEKANKRGKKFQIKINNNSAFLYYKKTQGCMKTNEDAVSIPAGVRAKNEYQKHAVELHKFSLCISEKGCTFAAII